MCDDCHTIDRRTYLTAAGVGATALLAGCSGAGVQREFDPIPGNAQGPAIPETGYLVDQIGPRLHVIMDGTYQVVFLDTDEGVVLLDAPPSLGDKIQQGIAEVTDRPVTHFIYSHAHNDHVGNAAAFAGATYIGNERTAALLDRYDDPNRPVPDETWDEEEELEIGGHTIQLSYRGQSHSDDTTYTYFEGQRALVVIDIVYPGWVPFQGFAAYVPGFVDAHDHILAYEFDTFVGGHLTRLGTREDVRVQKQYVGDVFDAVRAAAREVSFAEATEGVNPADRWASTGAYFDAVTENAVGRVVPAWEDRLGGVAAFAPSHCAAAFRAVRVDYGR
ncbi:MBL fold metallo-hydrolase [Natronomonas sp. EA1]|uniref:MBL fold metallo-hydrolase n=1 Tax=Natronomonas sp. EA1 TaxID=3421655 RepID=UPI003EC0E0B8